MESVYKVLSAQDIQEICTLEPRFKNVVKGYTGDIAYIEISKPMLIPANPKLAKYIDFVWPMVVFGGYNHESTIKAQIDKEVSKCLSGKTYSVKKLAELAEVAKF